MKRIPEILLCLIIFIPLPALSIEKDEVKSLILQAEEIVAEIDENSSIREHVPYYIYSDGIIDIIRARIQLEENTLDRAWYFISIARIKLKTARVLGEARRIKSRTDKMLLAYYKQSSLQEVSETLDMILVLGLKKKENIYKTDRPDDLLFRSREFKLQEEGMHELDRIIRLMKAMPGCRLKVVGHSSEFDYKDATVRKAHICRKYIIEKGIDPERVEATGLGNSEPVRTYGGFRRTDRVEFILFDLSFR